MTRPSAKPESAEATALAAESTEELRVEIKPTGTEPSSQQSPGKKSKQGKLVQAKSLDESNPPTQPPAAPAKPRKKKVAIDTSRGGPIGWLRVGGRRNISGVMVSMLVHLWCCLCLMYVVTNDGDNGEAVSLIGANGSDGSLELSSDSLEGPDTGEVFNAENLQQLAEQSVAIETIKVHSPLEQPQEQATTEMAATQASQQFAAAQSQDLLMTQSMAPTGGGFEGRRPDGRAEIVAQGGGSPGSESAVKKALEWLARHQLRDGSWRFDIHKGPCDGKCSHPGKMIVSSTAATSLALLPFLGAGCTPEEGPYKEVVRDGLYYLMSRQIQSQHGGDLQDAAQYGMYGHGLATITLCEAYAMTEDKDLLRACEQAIKFVVTAQHPKGGWRYKPGQAGDLSVTGWQLMALKSGQMAQLEVPSPTIEGARRFLNRMQMSSGARYGYEKPGTDLTPTAIGLLMRMYLGWPKDDPRLDNGVRFLASEGPSANDMYYNYYATQVLHHYGGPHWDRWNVKMRDYLVQSQSQRGHQAGSWYFGDAYDKKAGRLYTTAMSCMILEVYYRHMPLYDNNAVDNAF